MKEAINNGHQAIQQGWEQGILKNDRTIKGRFDKLAEEIEEVYTPFCQLQNPEEMTNEQKLYFAKEITDMIIIGLGCIDTLGYDFQNLFDEKMRSNFIKYNPQIIEHFVNQGLTREQAMIKAKELYNNR
jgi:predicted HAD superfamily Cof-like phosphohydrolase